MNVFLYQLNQYNDILYLSLLSNAGSEHQLCILNTVYFNCWFHSMVTTNIKLHSNVTTNALGFVWSRVNCQISENFQIPRI